MGRRTLIYWSAFILAIPGLGTLWLLVLAGILPPTPTDDWVSGIILVALFAPFAAFWDNPGETRTSDARFFEFGYVWLFASAMAQTFWELPWFFLDLTGAIHNAGPQDIFVWPWWSYAVADTRYLKSDPVIAGVEFCAGVAGPVEFFTIYLFRTGRRIAANWLALLIGVGLMWGAFIFFVAEIHQGFRNIGDGSYGFWVKWIGLNFPWTIAPIGFIPAAIRELRQIYHREGVEAYLTQQAPAE